MDKRDLLKSVLQNFINDKPDEAKANFHQYLTLKSKEITGLNAEPTPQSFTARESEHDIDSEIAEIDNARRAHNEEVS